MDFSVAKRHSRNPSAELKKFRKKKSTRPDKKKDPILRLIEKDSTMFKTKTLKERTQGSHINIKENIQGI